MIEAYFGRGSEVPASGFFGEALGFDGNRARVEWAGRGGAAGFTRAEVKQSALDGLGLKGSVALLDSLTAAGYRASRVDLWLDDPERRVTPRRVRDAVLNGQAVTHAQKGRFWIDDEDGRQTYYIGRAGSDRMVRVYDKLDPERTRFELQARREAARGAVSGLLAAGDPVPAVTGQLVRFVDFRQDKGRSDGSRSPRLDWWHELVGDVGKAEAAPIRPRLTIEELAHWFDLTLGKTVAQLDREMGPGWLESVMRRGRRRLAAFELAEEWIA